MPDSKEDTPKLGSVKELSLYISKASFDKKSQQMRCQAVASDTEEDSYGDSMSLELFADFISRIDTEEPAPEKYCSDYWNGGMPYLSIAHYSDQDGKGVAGEIEALYVDGNRLKEKFILYDNPIGRAIFKSIMDDLYSESPEYDDPVRVSIAFLDYKHKHKDGGYVFTRNSLTDTCPECARGNRNVTYLSGHLIHCAFTRVPVNPRTEIVDLEERSMEEIKTKRDDAASIVGDDVAEELEQNEKMIGRSDTLVVKSEEEPEVEDSEDVTEEVEKSEGKSVDVEEKAQYGPTSITDMIGEREATKELNRISDLFYMFSEVVYNIFRSEDVEDKKAKIENATKEFKDMLQAKSLLAKEGQDSILEKAWKVFSDTYEELPEEAAEEEKLRSIQPAFESLGEAIVQSVSEAEVDESVELEEGEMDLKALSVVLKNALMDANKPLLEKLSLLETVMVESQKKSSSVPQRRSLPANLVKQAVIIEPEQKEKKVLSSLSKLVNRSVGLPEDHARPGAVVKEEK